MIEIAIGIYLKFWVFQAQNTYEGICLPSFLFVLSVDATKYTGSVHHQVNSNLAAAAQVQWTSGTSNTALTVAGKYTIDSDTFVKVSIFQFSVCFSKW